MTSSAKADKHTLIISNAARLLADAKLLSDHGRFASAFALAVLGIEEIGKVILELWTPLAKPIARRTSHVRKQAAIASLLLASFAVKEFGDVEVDTVLTDNLLERVAKVFAESEEGKFLAHIQGGALEKTKHIGMYRDDWLEGASLHADQFDETDVTSIFEMARRATSMIGNARVMSVGRAIYETSP